MPKRQFQGTVVSNKMQKTVVVKVEGAKQHPKYKKRYRVSKKYKAHTGDGNFEIGDKVVIEETKPISKDKKWKVIKKISPQKQETADVENDGPLEV